MTQFTQVLSIFSVVMTVVGAAAFIWAYYMANLNRAQIAALRGDRDDLITRVGLLEADREALKDAAIIKDKTIAEATAKIAVLEGIVTHDATIKQLIAAVNRHDENVETKYETYMTVINKVLVSLELLLEQGQAN